MKKLLLLLLCVPLMFSCGSNENDIKQKRYDIYNQVFLSNDSTYLVDRDKNKLSGEIYLTSLHNKKEIYFGNVKNGIPYGKWRIYDDNGKNCIFNGELKDGRLIGEFNSVWIDFSDEGLDEMSNKFKKGIIFTIMFNDNIDGQNLELSNYLKNTTYFKEVIFIDKDTAFASLKADLGEDLSVLETNPLLDSYDAYVKAEFVSDEELKGIENYIYSYKGEGVVQDVFYQKNLFKKLNPDNIKSPAYSLIKLYNSQY